MPFVYEPNGKHEGLPPPPSEEEVAILAMSLQNLSFTSKLELPPMLYAVVPAAEPTVVAVDFPFDLASAVAPWPAELSALVGTVDVYFQALKTLRSVLARYDEPRFQYLMTRVASFDRARVLALRTSATRAVVFRVGPRAPGGGV